MALPCDGHFPLTNVEETRERCWKLVTCTLERAARGGSLLQERGCKATLHQSCWGEGALPVVMFLQPEAVLQHHPRKKAGPR